MNTDKSQGKIIIRRRAFSRSLRLSVNRHGQITVSAPLLYPLSLIYDFVGQHSDWIKQHTPKSPFTFTDNMTFTLLGQPVHICHLTDARTPTTLSGDTLFVSGRPEFINRRVSSFVKKQTLIYIQTKAQDMADKIGVSIHQIHLKDTTSRWGSCSSQHNLNFCWRLGLAPLFVLDYIIAHEVAHLQELNHSPAFWQIVARLTSDRSRAEIWLRRNGKSLYQTSSFTST